MHPFSTCLVATDKIIILKSLLDIHPFRKCMHEIDKLLNSLLNMHPVLKCLFATNKMNFIQDMHPFCKYLCEIGKLLNLNSLLGMHPFLRSLCATSKMITLNSLLNMHPLLKFLYRTDKTFTCSSLLAVILTYLAVGGGVSRSTFTGVAGHAVSTGAAVLTRVTRTLVDGWSGQQNHG